MTSEIGRVFSVVQWALDNSKKIQSVIASVGVYVGSLQGIAAAENGVGGDEWKHFWDLLVAQPFLIVPGVIGAAIAGWRTSSAPTARQERKAERKQQAKLDEYRQLKELDENGG